MSILLKTINIENCILKKVKLTRKVREMDRQGKTKVTRKGYRIRIIIGPNLEDKVTEVKIVINLGKELISSSHEFSTTRNRSILRRHGWDDIDNPYSRSIFCQARFNGHASKHE